ncbi:putative nitrogen fixation protein NifT [Phytobacter sp. V91]|uniref:putative nitrogen fixation protein NifT n=1 Tax=Phytobacter sp. V91 TaxID=3369425 RepID=UPI003F647781
MPVVIFRERGPDLWCYIAKQDLEAKVIAIEHDTPESWGGAISLEGGRQYFVNPQPGRPSFPISLRATRSALL